MKTARVGVWVIERALVIHQPHNETLSNACVDLGSWTPTGGDVGHRDLAAGLGRNPHRGVVKPQHQLITIDAAGRQPVAGAGTRRNNDLKAPIAAPDYFLTGEAVTVDRIGDQPAIRVVERQGPEASHRGYPRNDDLAASVKGFAVVIGLQAERNTIAHGRRQPASARDGSAGVRVGVDSPRLWPGCPAFNR
jgi:hypothetical protein